jgi:pyruvate,water dikinase
MLIGSCFTSLSLSLYQLQGEMTQSLCGVGASQACSSSASPPTSKSLLVNVNVPFGFCTTSAAYRRFLRDRGLDTKLQSILATLDTVFLSNLKTVGERCRQVFYDTTLTDELKEDILNNYQQLCDRYKPVQKTSASSAEYFVDCAVRSSATAEDLPDASFAGQQESFLNVHGPANILQSCLLCYASLFTDRAISYRERHGFKHEQVALRSEPHAMMPAVLCASYQQ